MKAPILVAAFLSFSFSLHAQIDTVLFENFQIDVFQLMDNEPTGNNVNWVNFDEDGLPTNLGTEESMQWLGVQPQAGSVDSITGEINFVASSSSFLDGFLPGNRNWLITPPQEIADDSYVFSWKSAPGQLPRYMDGYQVLISTTDNNLSSFTDTLFTAASMDQIIGDGQSTDFSNFTFTPGYIHANGGTDPNYYEEGTTVNFGLLEPHSVDLSAYEGQTVYLAFLHDSDDDESIQIDDILLTKVEGTSGFGEIEDTYSVEVYPNPADQVVNLDFELAQSKVVSYAVYNTLGKLVFGSDMKVYLPGIHNVRADLRNVPSGQYVIQLNVEGEVHNRGFLKR